MDSVLTILPSLTLVHWINFGKRRKKNLLARLWGITFTNFKIPVYKPRIALYVVFWCQYFDIKPWNEIQTLLLVQRVLRLWISIKDNCNKDESKGKIIVLLTMDMARDSLSIPSGDSLAPMWCGDTSCKEQKKKDFNTAWSGPYQKFMQK